MIDKVDLMMKYKLTPAMAQALLLLLTNKIVTPDMVELDKPITTDVKVLMHRLRRRMSGSAVEIRSQRSVGYWLDQASKEALIRECGDEQPSLPLDHGVKSESESLAA